VEEISSLIFKFSSAASISIHSLREQLEVPSDVVLEVYRTGIILYALLTLIRTGEICSIEIRG
jgi:hypothetical protein